MIKTEINETATRKIEKTTKLRAGFLRLNKTDKYLARLHKKKLEKNQINQKLM